MCSFIPPPPPPPPHHHTLFLFRFGFYVSTPCRPRSFWFVYNNPEKAIQSRWVSISVGPFRKTVFFLSYYIISWLLFHLFWFFSVTFRFNSKNQVCLCVSMSAWLDQTHGRWKKKFHQDDDKRRYFVLKKKKRIIIISWWIECNRWTKHIRGEHVRSHCWNISLCPLSYF